MTNELFLKVVELDEKINEACENGDFDAADKYEAEQNEIVEQIESSGLRSEFDRYIESMN